MVNAASKPATSTASAIAKPETAERGGLIPAPPSIAPRQHLLDLRVAWSDMIEARIKLARAQAQVLGEALWIEQPGEPPQPDQPVGAGRKIHPAERQLRRQKHGVVAHGLDRGPCGIAAHGGGKFRIYGDDHIRIPQEQLLERDICEAASRAPR